MRRMACLQVRTRRNVDTRQMVYTASCPSKMPATADANVDVTIGAKIDAQTDWDAVRTAVPRDVDKDVEERISRGFAVVSNSIHLGLYEQSWITEHRTQVF